MASLPFASPQEDDFDLCWICLGTAAEPGVSGVCASCWSLMMRTEEGSPKSKAQHTDRGGRAQRGHTHNTAQVLNACTQIHTHTKTQNKLKLEASQTSRAPTYSASEVRTVEAILHSSMHTPLHTTTPPFTLHALFRVSQTSITHTRVCIHTHHTHKWPLPTSVCIACNAPIERRQRDCLSRADALECATSDAWHGGR